MQPVRAYFFCSFILQIIDIVIYLLIFAVFYVNIIQISEMVVNLIYKKYSEKRLCPAFEKVFEKNIIFFAKRA